MVLLQKFSFLTFLCCSILLAHSPARRTQYPPCLQCQSHFDHCLSPDFPGHRIRAKLHGNPLFGVPSWDSKDENKTEVRQRRRKSKCKVVNQELTTEASENSWHLWRHELLGLAAGRWRGGGGASFVSTEPLVKFVYLLLSMDVCPAGRSPLHTSRPCCPGAPVGAVGGAGASGLRGFPADTDPVALPGGTGSSGWGWARDQACVLPADPACPPWLRAAPLAEAAQGPWVSSPEPGRLISRVQYNHFLCYSSVPSSFFTMLWLRIPVLNVKPVSIGSILFIAALRTFSISATILFLSLFLFRPTRPILISFCDLPSLFIFCSSSPLRMRRKFPGLFDFQTWLLWDIYSLSLFFFLKNKISEQSCVLRACDGKSFVRHLA